MTARVETAPLSRPPIGRLGRIELRKMADTRAGLWLLGILGLLAIAVVVLVLVEGEPADKRLSEMLPFTVGVVSVLLPVIGVLAVTSEWSQRTALTTFTLVPERGRVVVAKLLAAFALGLLSVAACLVASAAGNLIAGGSWSLELSALGGVALYQMLVMLVGFAFGAVFLNSALAIVLYFMVPTIWSILGEMIDALPAEWLDTSRAFEPLIENEMAGGGDWARLATSGALWILLPLVVGVLRLRRAEVKSS